jgi:hypothetical protein
MPRGTDFDPNQHINKALSAIDAQIAQLQAKRDQLAAVIGNGKKPKAAGATKAVKAKRPMSEESKQKIREAQQRRWAEEKAKGTAKKKK